MKTLSDSEIIDALGGTAAVARLCRIKQPSVSGWRVMGIPDARRQQTEPVRNKKINGQINDLRERLGHEAPDVAAFYVGINDGWLIKCSHSIGSLLQGCEGYHTQWITGRQVNSVTARQMENTQANIETIKQVNTRLKNGYINPLAALMAEAEAEERTQLLEKKRA